MLTAAFITMESAFVADAPTLSATFAVKLDVPAVVGVPVIAPPALIESPAGRLPEFTDHVRGAVPPVAASVWLYATPTVSAGRLAVVMLGAALITIESALVPDAPTVSAAFAVKLAVPVAVGVPLMTPPALMASPAGRLPAESDHVSAPVPPVAANVWLYATFIVSAGRLAVVTVTAALITMESAFVPVAPTLSVTFAVKLDIPDAVGVPLITPVPDARDSPVGRLPERTAHV